jgi:hypothetical protein
LRVSRVTYPPHPVDFTAARDPFRARAPGSFPRTVHHER